MATTPELSAAISAACRASQRAKDARARHDSHVAALTAAGHGAAMTGQKIRKAELRAALVKLDPDASPDAFLQRLYRERRAALVPTLNEGLSTWAAATRRAQPT